MDRQTLDVLIICFLAAFLLVGWLVACYIIWRDSSKRTALRVLLLSSAGMTVIRFCVSLAGLFLTPLDHTDISSYVFDWTFGFPHNQIIRLHHLSPESANTLGGNIEGLLFQCILPILADIAFFFLLGLLPSLFVKPREQRLAEHQAAR